MPPGYQYAPAAPPRGQLGQVVEPGAGVADREGCGQLEQEPPLRQDSPHARTASVPARPRAASTKPVTIHRIRVLLRRILRLHDWKSYCHAAIVTAGQAVRGLRRGSRPPPARPVPRAAHRPALIRGAVLTSPPLQVSGCVVPILRSEPAPGDVFRPPSSPHSFQQLRRARASRAHESRTSSAATHLSVASTRVPGRDRSTDATGQTKRNGEPVGCIPKR